MNPLPWRLPLRVACVLGLLVALVPAWRGHSAPKSDADRDPPAEPPAENLPLLEDVQPAGVRPGQIAVNLPITSFLAFQGDFVSIPIKLACGRGRSHEVSLTMGVMLKSSQTGPVIAPNLGADPRPPIRWVNGYSSNLLERPEMLAPHIARCNPELPVTKYLRFKVHDQCPPEVYTLRIEARSDRNDQRIVKHVKLGVHVGFIFADPALNLMGNRLRAQFRDIQGNVVIPECAYLRATAMNDSRVLHFELVDPANGFFDVFVGEDLLMNINNYEFQMNILRRGFTAYQKTVNLQ